jgi:phosphoribosylanthranilate isomerase
VSEPARAEARVRVKICGITSEEDALLSVRLGADALGFNTWSGSKRFLDLDAAAEWIAALPPFVARVALLVNAPIEEAERIARLPFLDALQLHGDEDAAYCRRLAATGRPVIKAIRLRDIATLDEAAAFPVRHFLLDAHVEGQFGGTGAAVNLPLAAEFRRRHPASFPILAGGLRPDNVAAAIRAARPYAVDVSSGVESSPGRKDPALVRAFMEAVRGA